jgi:hypothetical protein
VERNRDQAIRAVVAAAPKLDGQNPPQMGRIVQILSELGRLEQFVDGEPIVKGRNTGLVRRRVLQAAPTGKFRGKREGAMRAGEWDGGEILMARRAQVEQTFWLISAQDAITPDHG